MGKTMGSQTWDMSGVGWAVNWIGTVHRTCSAFERPVDGGRWGRAE
jgi:hypothetical protein